MCAHPVFTSFHDSPSTSRRGAAVRARKSLTALNPRSGLNLDTLEQADKTIRLLKRNRKQRHAKLREIIAQDEKECELKRDVSGGTACPICLVVVRGDADVVEAHVDACVAHASRLQAETEDREAREREDDVDVDAWEDYEVDGEVRIRLSNVTGLRGTGFQVRDRSQRDVEDEVDVDGDDEAVFGDAQFTERDVLEPTMTANTVEAPTGNNVGNDWNTSERRGLRELVAEGKVITREAVASDIDGVKAEMEQVMGVGDADRMDQAVLNARRSGSMPALISALEDKVKQLVSSGVPHASGVTDRKAEYRSPCVCRRQPPYFVEYVLIHTTSQRYPLGAGTHAVVNAGYDVSGLRSCVLFASVLPRRRTCGRFTCRLLL